MIVRHIFRDEKICVSWFTNPTVPQYDNGIWQHGVVAWKRH
jgi:hypothetical protein